MKALAMTALGGIAVNKTMTVSIYIPDEFVELFGDEATLRYSNGLIYVLPKEGGYSIHNSMKGTARKRVTVPLKVVPGLMASFHFGKTDAEFTRTTFDGMNAISTPLVGTLKPAAKPAASILKDKWPGLTDAQVLDAIRTDLRTAAETRAFSDYCFEDGVLQASVSVVVTMKERI
jgi:hypothetical protein